MLTEMLAERGIKDKSHGGTFMEGMAISAVTGFIGGTAAVIAMNPADVIRTR